MDDETGADVSGPKHLEMEDSRGTLCRNRRLFGTPERLRCGWAGQDREGGGWVPRMWDVNGLVPPSLRVKI